MESDKMDEISEKQALIVLYLISKKTNLKKSNFESLQESWPDPSLQRCVHKVLTNRQHFYGDGLKFVDPSEELEAATKFVELVRNKENFNLEGSTTLYLQIANGFITSYITELKREYDLSRGMRELTVEVPPVKFIADFGLMTHLLGHLRSGQLNYEVVKNLMKSNIEAVEAILSPTSPHIAKVHEDLLLLDQLLALKLWLELITNDCWRTEETFSRLKATLKSVKVLRQYNQLVKLLFELLFLQHEDLKNDGSLGFICQKSIVEQMLNFLKIIQQQKVHSKEFTAGDEADRDKFNDQFDKIKTALWLLSMFEERPPQQERNLVCLRASSLFNPQKPPQSSSDDEDTKTAAPSKKYSTYPRKKAQKKRVQQKSDGTGSATAVHPQAGSSSFPNCEDEQLMQQSSANVIAKMLARPEALVAVCLYKNDVENVAAVIKTFNLESAPLSKQLTVFEAFATTKSALRTIIDKFEREKRQPTPESMISQITKATVLGFEASKVVNKLEALVINSLTAFDEETRSIVEQYKSTVPMLADGQQSIIVDMMLSLSLGHDLNLNLKQLFNKWSTEKSKDQQPVTIGYHKFVDNVMAALASYKTVMGRDYTIDELLTHEFYRLDASALQQKLESVQSVCTFLAHEKDEYAATGHIKSGHRLLPTKSLNRVQSLVKNVEEVLKFVKREPSNKSTILKMDLEVLLGEMMFNSSQTPNVVEAYARSANLNFTHVLTVNCLPKIYNHHSNKIESDQCLKKFHNNFDNEFSPTKEHAPAFILDATHLPLLKFVQSNNEMVAYLLSGIFNIPLQFSKTYPHFSNLLATERVERNLALGLSTSKVLAALTFDRLSVPKLCQLLNQSKGQEVLIEILKTIDTVQYRQHSEILDGIKDVCLLKLIFDPARPVEKYELIIRISEHNLRADTVLKCLTKIKSVELADRLIKQQLLLLACHRPTTAKTTDYRKKLQIWHDNIEVYKTIAESIDGLDWIEVMTKSTVLPEHILQHLLERKLYALCLKWTEIHPLKEIKQRNFSDILENFATALQDCNACDPALMRIIESYAPQQRLIEFIDSMIMAGNWRNVLLLRQFLKYASAKHLVTISAKKVQKYRLSLAIFETITECEYKALWRLVAKPLLIVEQFLMNSKFVVLRRVFETIRPVLDKPTVGKCQFCITDSELSPFYVDTTSATQFMNVHRDEFVTSACLDTLIRIYAASALDFRVSEQRSSIANSLTTNEMSSLDSLCDDFVLPKIVPAKANWVEDGAVTHCMCCKRVPFTMLTRRHHCRRCGRVVCHACSRNRLEIPEMYADIAVRCCDDCFRVLADLSQRKPRVVAQQAVDLQPGSTGEDDEWVLSGNLKHDYLLRDEFSYEFAPSVALCLSIVTFHSKDNNAECVNFLLHHCRKLQGVLRPLEPGVPNPEVDYVLVTRMLNCLILAAKVRGGEPTECNSIVDYAEIITSVVRNGCQHLLQMEPLGGSGLRRLCDSLVRAEKWELALELSMKCGFQLNGIMATWGMSCLKAGCYTTAREKLGYCMSRIEDDGLKNLSNQLEAPIVLKCLSQTVGVKRPTKAPPLLIEILKVLESNRWDQQKPVHLERTNSTTSSNLSLAAQKLKAKANMPLNEPALNIQAAIANLKQITRGVYTNDLKAVRCNSQLVAASRDYLPQVNIVKTRFYEESMFYLLNYGCHADIVRFLVQNKLISHALKYTLLQRVDTGTFIHQVFMPHIKHGQMSTIIELMTEIDNTMLVWKDYITQTCRYLEVNRLLNSLYQLQNLLQDPIRASMTSVRFYSMQCSTFADLLVNTHHLINAKKHLQSELELCNWEEIKMTDSVSSLSGGSTASVKDSSLSMKMDLKTLNGHINTINRQIEIVKFLAECEKRNGADAMQVLSKIFVEVPHLPTLFGKVSEKIQLAVLTLVCGKNVEEGFGVSFRIIQDFNLNSVKIYGLTSKYLAAHNRINEVEKLVECIKSNADKEPVTKICDEIICLAVKTAIDCHGPKVKSIIDGLIKLVFETETKIQCYISSGQLKSAYLLAVQHNRLNDVKKILRQAEKTNQPHIKRLCEKKLNLNSNTVT